MVRGTGRGGRGMPGRGGMGRPPFNRPRVLMLRPPFDLILAEPAFPRCKPAPDDSALTQVLRRKLCICFLILCLVIAISNAKF